MHFQQQLRTSYIQEKSPYYDIPRIVDARHANEKSITAVLTWGAAEHTHTHMHTDNRFFKNANPEALFSFGVSGPHKIPLRILTLRVTRGWHTANTHASTKGVLPSQ